MTSILDIAAEFLVEDTNLIMESFHDESVDQAKKYIENNYDELYKFRGFEELRPEKPNDLKAFAAQKVRDIQGMIIYPFMYAPRNEMKWLNSYVLGLVRIMYKELLFDKPKFKQGLVSDLKQVYFTAVYARQDGIAKNDKSLMMDKNMNGLSLNELKAKFLPMFDHYYEIYSKNKDEYIKNKKSTEGEETKHFVVNSSVRYDGGGNEIKHFDEPYHENSFKIGKYNACLIPNHNAAATWNKLTNKTSDALGCNWCITIPTDPSHWNGYGCGTKRTVYFCWTDDFMNLNVKDFNDGSAPYNRWGESLICVMVNGSNDVNTFIEQVTSRYNHCDGEGNSGSSSLGFGDYFCGEPGSTGMADKLADILGCSVKEIQQKMVFEGTPEDEDDGSEARDYARAMESVEYYTNDFRFDKFTLCAKLPENYALVGFYEHGYDDSVDVKILLKNNKPVPNFMYGDADALYIGKTIDDCVFRVVNNYVRDGHSQNIVIGPNTDTYFDHNFYNIIPLYAYKTSFEPTFSDAQYSTKNRLLFCSLDSTGRANVYDLDKEQFLLESPVFIESVFEKDGEIILAINVGNRQICKNFEDVCIYNTATEKTYYIKNEYIPDLNTAIIDDKLRFDKSCIYRSLDRLILFDLYNMKPVKYKCNHISDSSSLEKGYVIAYNSDDSNRYSGIMLYNGEKIDDINSYSNIRILKYNTRTPNVAIVEYNDEVKEQHKVYYNSKLVYNSETSDFDEGYEPFVVGKILYIRTKGLKEFDDINFQKHVLINMENNEIISKDMYLDEGYFDDEASVNKGLVIGTKFDESDSFNYVIIDKDGNFKNITSVEDDDGTTSIATISSGDSTIIVIGAELSRNHGDPNVLVECARFNINNPLIYKTDGSLLFKQEETEFTDLQYETIAPLGYGFWLLTRKARSPYGFRTIHDIIDKNGNVIFGNNDGVMTHIEILEHFTRDEDLKVDVTKYNKYFDSRKYSISKDGKITRGGFDRANTMESYIQNIAAYLL